MASADLISSTVLPTKSIIICSTGRSGSTLLSRTLSSLGYFGKPIEFFRFDMLADNGVTTSATELYRYLGQVYPLGTTPNQVFSAKLHWDHLRKLLQIARTDPVLKSQSEIEILSQLFPNPIFIFIRRNDLSRQAISMEIGRQTGVYLILKEQDKKPPQDKQRLFFRPLNIYRYKQGLQQRNQNWRSLFHRNHMSFLEVVYEDLVTDFEGTMHQVIKTCDVAIPAENFEISQATKKQGNQVNERWLRYYCLIPESFLKAYSNARSYLRQLIAKR
ncbi:Stf0 family sulfotransferase [Leptothoe spongobia]|uniref:Sulfotransferase n=1 Tax=Leptothoe spongobia TAU-MAC 1115 TaxID=1967444 RepID=A0A947DDV6_9CYAN|nr:Stf0 family sulfotransferase [Leptothoe spongobia]MBT9314779.1 sulfotransferase [Leptothoe spongobia TAU-MAC 1115]